MAEPSGTSWCARFPTSTRLGDLAPPFRDGAKAFVGAVRIAGADVDVIATFRPAERAYLMHWCCQIAGYRDAAHVFHQVQPEAVPPLAGVAIDWTHGGDLGAARAAAVAMREAYAIVFPAALQSRHTQRLAMDLRFSWAGKISVLDRHGVFCDIASPPRDGTNPILAAIGKTYGVIKLLADPPHWSSDGH